MGYSVYEDRENDRWAGYGVPAECDATDCHEEIDRGLGYKCEESVSYTEDEDEVVEEGCGLFLCGAHRSLDCSEHAKYTPKPDSLEWIRHVLTDPSWKQWRAENLAQYATLKERLR